MLGFTRGRGSWSLRHNDKIMITGYLKYYPVLVRSRIPPRFDSFSIGPMVAHWCSDHCQWVASGRPMGWQKKKMVVVDCWSVADGQAASAQIAEIQWAVGGPLVKPSADLWGFVRWATSNPLTTAAAARGSSVDSQTISGGPPLTRTSFISSIDYNVFIVLQCHLKDHLCRKVT